MEKKQNNETVMQRVYQGLSSSSGQLEFPLRQVKFHACLRSGQEPGKHAYN